MSVPSFHRFLMEEKKKGAAKPVFTARPVTAKTLVDFTYDWIHANPIFDTTTFKDVSGYRYKDSGEDVANDQCVVGTFGADDLEITVNEEHQQRKRTQ